MNNVPIFDSLTHPMPDGCWLSKGGIETNTVDNLLLGMEENNIQWALAVGMGESVGGYKENNYAEFIRSCSDKLFPIAFVDISRLENEVALIDYLRNLYNLGYVGIKIHPRISRISFSHPLLPSLIKEANQLDLSVLICTYFWSNDKKLRCNTLEHLTDLLYEVPDERVVLLHGGAVRLLEMAEIVRHFKNVLMDLSFTICKYEGSSIDLDIRYLFEMFDQRLCVGSDSPEFGHRRLRTRFEHFAKGLSVEKKKNIAFRNLQNHIGLKL